MKMNQKLNSQATFPLVSIRDRHSGRQANNLLDQQLGETIRPWFAGIEMSDIDWALTALDRPEQRDSAAAFLGLEILPVS